jgi:hypothetical protein
MEMIRISQETSKMKILLTADKVLLLLLDVENDGACDGHFGYEVEVTQDEENLARVLIL